MSNVAFPYSRFAEDTRAYRKSREFWSQAFSESLGSSRADQWLDWIDDIFQDGNPIFSKINRSLGRGILVQQTSVGRDRYWFKCWISHAEENDHVVPYLFVETFIAGETKTYFDELIKAWCVDGFGEDDMANLTEKTRLTASERFDGIDFATPA